MVSSGRTHYSTLGVASSASQAEIRDAYRTLARQFHPDRVANSAAGADRMPAVNEAYRVLSDPARRAVYDASLRGGSTRIAGSSDAPGRNATADHGHDEDYAIRLRESQRPISVPWRTIAVLAGLAVVGIVVLAQFGGSDDQAPIDGIMRIGDCAEVLPDGRAAEVACTPGDGEADLVVQALVPFGDRCDFGYAQHQDRQGMGIVCLDEEP